MDFSYFNWTLNNTFEIKIKNIYNTKDNIICQFYKTSTLNIYNIKFFIEDKQSLYNFLNLNKEFSSMEDVVFYCKESFERMFNEY